MAIEHTLHQIWCGPKPPPAEVLRFMDDTKAMNSDMEYRRHGNEIIQRYETDPYIRYMMGAKEQWAFIVDRIRVLLLRDEGGLYIDADARPIKPASTLPIWGRKDIDFVAGFRDPYRQGVALHRGISLVDNTFLASARGGRIANRLVELYHSQAPKRDGHDIGCEILANSREDVVWLNFRYVYAMEKHPDTVFLHDDQNLGSWCSQRQIQFAER